MRFKLCLKLVAAVVALLGVTTFSPAPTLAQTGSVQGQVLDADSRRPLSNAQSFY